MNTQKHTKDDYMGSKYSQHIYPNAEVDNIIDTKEDNPYNVSKDDEMYREAMKNSQYQRKFTLGIFFTKNRG